MLQRDKCVGDKGQEGLDQEQDQQDTQLALILGGQASILPLVTRAPREAASSPRSETALSSYRPVAPETRRMARYSWSRRAISSSDSLNLMAPALSSAWRAFVAPGIATTACP